MTIEMGQDAPSFELRDQMHHVVRLDDYASRSNVVLAFFSFAFSGVAQRELADLAVHHEEFESANAQILGVSCDASYALERWGHELDLAFPLLADFWPHGEVAGRYGVFDMTLGCASRTTFFIDRSGKIVDVLQGGADDVPRSFADHEEGLQMFR